jgi:hypothetical protein
MPGTSIPGDSDLLVQLGEVEMLEKQSSSGKSTFKLVVSDTPEQGKWLQSSPSREQGRFRFDQITGKKSWESLFGSVNPNSFLSVNGRSVAFERDISG